MCEIVQFIVQTITGSVSNAVYIIVNSLELYSNYYYWEGTQKVKQVNYVLLGTTPIIQKAR